MLQLSNDVCTFSLALFCQKLLVFLQVEVASSPRGFDDFENTHGPKTFNLLKLQESYGHHWKAEA